MAKAIKEKAVCKKCGVDVREGTAFCYNCGANVAGDGANETVAAGVTEPAAATDIKAKDATPTGEKLSQAAEQRRKARVVQRRSNEYTWEPTEDSRLAILFAVLITVIAFGIVFLTVYWK